MIAFDFSSSCSNQEVITELVPQIMLKLGISSYGFNVVDNQTPCLYSFQLPDFYLSSEVFSVLISVVVKLPFVALLWLVFHLFYNLIPGDS